MWRQGEEDLSIDVGEGVLFAHCERDRYRHPRFEL